MKTFSVKAILISFGLVAMIDIVLIVKNLTYTLLKSFCEAKGSLLMPSSKSSASVVLLTSGSAGFVCKQPKLKYSLNFHLFFQYLLIQPANFICKQDGYVIIFS